MVAKGWTMGTREWFHPDLPIRNAFQEYAFDGFSRTS